MNWIRSLIFDNWVARLVYVIKQIRRHGPLLEQLNIRVSWLRMCLYTVLPLEKYPPEVMQRHEGRTALINKHILEKGEKLRPVGLNEMLYHEVEEVDMYNVIVKFKPNFPIVSRIVYTLLFLAFLWLVHDNTIIFDRLFEWAGAYLRQAYELIEKK